MARLCRAMLLLASAVAAASVANLGLQFPYIFCLLLLGALARRAKVWHSSYAHGSARIASLFDLLRARMMGQEGLILGRASETEPPTRWQALRCLLAPGISSQLACRMFLAALWRRSSSNLIRIKSYVHLLTVAPAGAGKSTAVLVPNLRSYRGACVVIDPKGELYELTAEHRQKVFGHEIIRLDPLGVAGPAATSDGLNPFDFIQEDSLEFLDDCRALVELLVMRNGNEREPHWSERAGNVLTAFIAFTCALQSDLARRNLCLVRDLVASEHTYEEALKTMQQVKGFRGVIDRLGFKLTWLKDRELGGVQSTLSRHIDWMDSPALEESISKSTFDPRSLRDGKMTVYICLPHHKLVTLAPVMRLWLGTIMRQVTRDGASEKGSVLFLVDEAAHLGKMQSLEDAFTLMRGYGIRVWLFMQSLEQLKRCYGDKASEILDNAGTQQYFGITSYETAEHLSKRIGQATILTESTNRSFSRSRPSGGVSQGEGGNTSTSDGVTTNEMGRPIFRAEEILVQPKNQALVFHQKQPVILARLAHYYDAPEFRDGGTGQGRRLGLPTLITSAAVLLASFLFAGLLACVPSPESLRRAAFNPGPRIMQRQAVRFVPPATPVADPLEWSLDPFLDPRVRPPVANRPAPVRPRARPFTGPPLGWRGPVDAQRRQRSADDPLSFPGTPDR